jgi:hypothetical protein
LTADGFSPDPFTDPHDANTVTKVIATTINPATVTFLMPCPKVIITINSKLSKQSGERTLNFWSSESKAMLALALPSRDKSHGTKLHNSQL